MKVSGLKKIEIITFVVLLWFSGFGFGEDFTRLFLHLPPDAVSQSIGGANPAYAIGAVDIFFNPALLSEHLSKSMQFSNIIDLRGLQYSSIALAMSLSERNFIGIGLENQLNSDPPKSDRENVAITLIEPTQYALFLAYARNFNSWSVGTTFQYYQMRYRRNSIAISDKIVMINLGGYYALSPDFQAGFTVQMPVWAEEIPPKIAPSGKLAFGVLWKPFISEQFPIQMALSVNRRDNSPLKLSGGVIYTPAVNALKGSSISFRAGIGDLEFNGQTAPKQTVNSLEEPPFFTIGAGFGFDTSEKWGINIDYCFQVKEYISNKHIVTTRIRF
jgi:hypothetical protein